MGLSLIGYVIGSLLLASVLSAPMQHTQTSVNHNGVGNTGHPSLEDRVLVVERKLNLNEHKLNQVDDRMSYIVGIIMHQLNWTNPVYGQNNDNVYNQSSGTMMNQNVNHSSTAINGLQEQVSHPPANHHQRSQDQSQSRGALHTPNHQTNMRNTHQQQHSVGNHRNNPFERLFSFEQNSMERTLSRIFFNQPLGGASTGYESFEDFGHHSRGLNTRNPGQYPHVGGRGVGNNHSNNKNNNGNSHDTTSQDSSNANSGRNTDNSSTNRNQQENIDVRSDTNSGTDHADSLSSTTNNNDHSAVNKNQHTNTNSQSTSQSDKTDHSQTPNHETINQPDISSNSKHRHNENTTETETITRPESQKNGNTENEWQNEEPTSQTGPYNKQEPTTFNRPEDNSHKNNQHPEMGDPELLGENETEWGEKDNKFENTHDVEHTEHNMMEDEQEMGGNQYHGERDGEGQQEEGIENEGNNEDQEEAAPETQQATDLGELQAEHPGESPFERAPRPVLPAEVEN